MIITEVKLLLINSMAGSFMMPQRITVFIAFLTNITIQGHSGLLMRVLNMSPTVMLSYSKCFSTRAHVKPRPSGSSMILSSILSVDPDMEGLGPRPVSKT